jgi:hypothetical protein
MFVNKSTTATNFGKQIRATKSEGSPGTHDHMNTSSLQNAEKSPVDGHMFETHMNRQQKNKMSYIELRTAAWEVVEASL